MPLTSGTRLGAYEILAPLGADGMGEVYRARGYVTTYSNEMVNGRDAAIAWRDEARGSADALGESS